MDVKRGSTGVKNDVYGVGDLKMGGSGNGKKIFRFQNCLGSAIIRMGGKNSGGRRQSTGEGGRGH